MDSKFFVSEASGDKPHTIRTDDRPFENGDFLFIQEFSDIEDYAGEYVFATITSVFGRKSYEKKYVPEGKVILEKKVLKDAPNTKMDLPFL